MTPAFDIHDVLTLASVPGLGSFRLRNLIAHFADPRRVLTASPRELIRVEGIDRKIASLIAHRTGDGAFVEEQLSALNRVGGSIVTFWDRDYPEALRKIYDPPALLFVRGTLQSVDRYAVAIVGTRRPTEYGRMMAERFAQELVKMGITVVSGLARGVDTAAHTAAIRSGGRTLAIIGSSIDRIYPVENRKLVEQIEERDAGAVISEFYMGTKTDPGNFPRRNRIISGLSHGTLIVESDHDGGAMITASTTLDQNRELFCLPGPITERKSNGTNRLIKQGQAKLVQSLDDILEELTVPLRPLLKVPPKEPALPDLTMFEQQLYDLLSDTPMHIDVITERSSFTPADALVTLLSLEFKSVIKQLPGKYFVKM